MPLKGFIFDLDGTLLDTLPVCYAGFRATLRRYLGREYSDPEIAALFGPSEAGIFQTLLPDRWQEALRDYLDEYERAHGESVTFTGIPTALAGLRERSIRLAIVSGKGRGSLDISLRYSGLGEFFEIVIAGSDRGARKPDHLRQVLEAWGYAPEEVAYVGDTAYDIQAAREAGVHPVAALWAATANPERVQAMRPWLTFETVPAFIGWIREAGSIDMS